VALTIAAIANTVVIAFFFTEISYEQRQLYKLVKEDEKRLQKREQDLQRRVEEVTITSYQECKSKCENE